MPRIKNEYGLTAKEEIFAQEVASGLELSLAYRKAYAVRTMKPDTVRQRAYELSRKPVVAARIKSIAAPAIEQAVEEAQISRKRITTEMAHRAFYDPADFINVKSPKDIARLSESVRRAICGWSYDKFGNFVIKLADKDKSLRNLGETIALFTVNNNNRNMDTPNLSDIDDETLMKMFSEAGQ